MLQFTPIRRLRHALLFAIVLIALGANGRIATAAGATQVDDGVRATGNFVIGDFDGDQKPDLLTVQVDQSYLMVTEYSIHLQLSRGLQSAIGLTAPSGGLRLYSRDVNGDENLDVVVRTAVNSHLVAVLINDGHGNFTLTNPELYPALQQEPTDQWSEQAQINAGRELQLPPRGLVGEEVESGKVTCIQEASEAVAMKEDTDFCSAFYLSLSGRSPPAVL